MMVVHIFLLGVYFFGLTYCTRDLYALFLFSSGAALESIIHQLCKKKTAKAVFFGTKLF